jgi:phage tail-like protein
MSQRIDPVLSFNFLITFVDSGSTLATVPYDLKTSPWGGFSECSGLDTTLEVEDYKEGGNNGTVLKFPTRVTWANIRLKRGLAISHLLWDWHYKFVQGNGIRKDGIIILQDEQQNPIQVWQFMRGLPIKWGGPSMNAAQSQVALEELEIAHEGLTLAPQALSVSLGQIVSAGQDVGAAAGGLF